MPLLGGNPYYSQDTLAASAARTAPGATGALTGYGGASTLRVQLNVTAASGTAPTLDVIIQDSVDGTNWNTIGTFTQKVAAAREVINITTPFADTIRVNWAIAGTGPSFTFDVQATAQGPLA